MSFVSHTVMSAAQMGNEVSVQAQRKKQRGKRVIGMNAKKKGSHFCNPLNIGGESVIRTRDLRIMILNQ